jgi:hypothetical protein
VADRVFAKLSLSLDWNLQLHRIHWQTETVCIAFVVHFIDVPFTFLFLFFFFFLALFLLPNASIYCLSFSFLVSAGACMVSCVLRVPMERKQCC